MCQLKQDMMVVFRYKFGLMWKKENKIVLFIAKIASGPVGRLKASIFGPPSGMRGPRRQNGVSWNHSCALQPRQELAEIL